jgi:hypothetical protein
MARFVDWWNTDTATPAGIAAAAAAAGVLVESGDYTIGTLDLGDDGPPIGIQVAGAVVNAHGASWLVHPAPSAGDGWLARPVERVDQAVRPARVPACRLAGADAPAERVVAELLAGERTRAYVGAPT